MWLVDVVVVQPVVGDELVHQRQRERRVGARAQGDVLVALVGGFGAARIDAHQACAVAFRLLGQPPEMQVAGNGVAAPDQDQLAFCEMLHLHAHFGAQGGHERFSACAGTDRALKVGGAQLVEKARGHAFALDLPHGAGVAVGEDGLRVSRRNGFQALGDGVQRFVPAHGCELPAALGAGAFERAQDALRVVGALGVPRDFGAQGTIGVAVLGVALYANRHAAFDCGDQRAGVGAVMRASAAHCAVATAGFCGCHEICKLL